MAVSNSKTIIGVDDALKKLRKVEPEYVNQFRKQARRYAADAVTSAKKEFMHTQTEWRDPGVPLVNMKSGFLVKSRGMRWNARKARAGIKFKLGGVTKKQKKNARMYRMFSIVQADAAGALYDMAGKRMSNPEKNFEETLAQYDAPHLQRQEGYPDRGPSRYMWPGVVAYLPALEDKMLLLVYELERKVNRQLVVRPKVKS